MESRALQHYCIQEKLLGAQEATLTHISHTLERIAAANEIIAAQGEAIVELKKSTKVLFERVRELEMTPGKEGAKMKHNIVLAIATVIGSYLVAFFTKR